MTKEQFDACAPVYAAAKTDNGFYPIEKFRWDDLMCARGWMGASYERTWARAPIHNYGVDNYLAMHRIMRNRRLEEEGYDPALVWAPEPSQDELARRILAAEESGKKKKRPRR